MQCLHKWMKGLMRCWKWYHSSMIHINQGMCIRLYCCLGEITGDTCMYGSQIYLAEIICGVCTYSLSICLSKIASDKCAYNWWYYLARFAWDMCVYHTWWYLAHIAWDRSSCVYRSWSSLGLPLRHECVLRIVPFRVGDLELVLLCPLFTKLVHCPALIIECGHFDVQMIIFVIFTD